MFSMNKLSAEKRKQIVSSLVEGNSLRSTARMTGVSLNTVTKLLTDLGVVCSIYQDRALRDLDCKRIQADEIWSFVGAKEKHVKPDKRAEGWGSVWTWTALDPDTKLVVSYRAGPRDLDEATALM